MNKQPTPQLRLKPGGFRRHNHVVVSHAKQIFYIYRIYGERYFHVVVHSLFQFFQTTDTAYEVDTLVCTRVFNTQDRVKQAVLQNGHIQRLCHVIRDNGILSSQLVPFAIQEHSEDMLAFRIVDVAAFFFYFKSSFLNLCQELFLGIPIQVP